MSDGNVYGFDHKNKSTISFSQSEAIASDDMEWGHLMTKKVQNIVYLFTAFKISCIYSGAKQQSYAAIAHGKYISLFNITEWRWINHLEFQDDIIHMFTHIHKDGSTYTSCMTKKGWIYIGFMYDGGKWETVVHETWRGAYTPGKQISIADDIENNKTLFVIHQAPEDNNPHLSMLYAGVLSNWDHLLTSKDRLAVAVMQSREANSYIMI